MTTLTSFILPTQYTTFATLTAANTGTNNAAAAEFGALKASGQPLSDAGLTTFIANENENTWYSGQFNVPGTAILVNKWIAYGAAAVALFVLMK